MYDDLVKKLRYCGNAVSCVRCPYWEGCEGSKEDLIRAANVIEELIRDLDSMNDANIALYGALPQWIPVWERLPEDRHDVLVYAGVLFHYITVGYYDELWKFSYNDEEIAGSADYWMPLPEPPKDGEK